MSDLDISTKAAPARSTAKAAALEGKPGTTRIVIPKTKDAINDVPVGVNGTMWLIKRGVPVDVPNHVVEVLENARGMEYERQVDPVTGRAELIPQETMSYPFQRV